VNATLYAAFGTVFGWVLSRSGAADYDFIQGMFLFTNLQLYGIIGTAVAVTAPGLWLLKRRGTTAFGAALKVKPKPRHPGNVAGGVLWQALRPGRTGGCTRRRRTLRRALRALPDGPSPAGAQGRHRGRLGV
jgi:hypothetical protein